MKKTARKWLSVLLSALMLLSVLSVGMVASAEVTISGSRPTITFYVPETIYLKASDNKTRSASSSSP